MSEGWKCPHCGKAHGPHVDTCPVEIHSDGWTAINPLPPGTKIKGTNGQDYVIEPVAEYKTAVTELNRFPDLPPALDRRPRH